MCEKSAENATNLVGDQISGGVVATVVVESAALDESRITSRGCGLTRKNCIAFR